MRHFGSRRAEQFQSFPAVGKAFAEPDSVPVFSIPIPWTELVRRTVRDFSEDECTGLAAQLACYYFLANAESGGLLTFGVLGALWSSSAAILSIALPAGGRSPT